jgi:histidinol-phosphate aminotransferase
MSGYARRSPADLIRPEVLAMAGYHVPDSTGLLKLDAMENPYRLPPELRRALGERLAAVAINRYPVPSYARLKSLVRERMGVPASAEVLLGNGSDELITMMSVATARPGATVVAPTPSFVMYDLSTRLAGSRFVPVPLAADFSLDLPAMLAAIERHSPALVWLAYPNNPTGNCFERAGPGRARRGLPAVRARHLDGRAAAPRQPGRDAHRLQARTGRHPDRLHGRGAPLDR